MTLPLPNGPERRAKILREFCSALEPHGLTIVRSLEYFGALLVIDSQKARELVTRGVARYVC
jgi:hypothetical protein